MSEKESISIIDELHRSEDRINDRINELKTDVFKYIEKSHNDVAESVSNLFSDTYEKIGKHDRRIRELEKYRWIVLGGVVVLMFVIELFI